jgi:hypothetical protein
VKARVSGEVLGKCNRRVPRGLRAVVKKVVFDDVQVSARNSTIPSRMGGKPEKSFELMRPTGAVE